MVRLADSRWRRRQVQKLIQGLTLYRLWGKKFDRTVHDLLTSMPIFNPNSGGSYHAKVPLALRSANESFPLMAELAVRVGHREIEITDLGELEDTTPSTHTQMQELFETYGSDKGGFHNYHLLYAHLFPDPSTPRKIFEIGLGTNNTDVVSSMGYYGKPGASLRAFRDFYTNALIFGADIDRRILFNEERIQTYHLDQSNDETFAALPYEARSDLDLFIDDGLHAPDANLRSLRHACGMVRPGGSIVIEDIREEALPVWQVAAALLGNDWSPRIYRAARAYMFVCKRPV